MKQFFKNLYDPAKCDDEKLAKRFLFTEKVISVGASMVLTSAIAGFVGVFAGIAAIAGSIPWIVPAALIGGGLGIFGVGLPITGWGNSKHIDYIAEFERRQINTPGEHPYVRVSPKPAPVVAAAPILSEIFDPAAAVTLKDRMRAMPAIKLARKGLGV